MKALPSLLAASVWTAIALANNQPPVSVEFVPGTIASGPADVQFTSSGIGFDAPKINAVNSTVFDWWYFDAVSSDLGGSVVITAFTANTSALWDNVPDVGTTTWFSAHFTLANGTAAAFTLPAKNLTVVTIGDGCSGSYGGLNAGFYGTPDMSTYVVTVNAPDQGIQGSFTLRSVAPAHFPCSPAVAPAGKSFEMSPGLGWANAIPDGNAIVDFVLNGEKLYFTGPGYHDKNWGSEPLQATANSWYWGHGRAGPYSIVWFDLIAPNGKEHASGYVAKDGKILTASCSDIKVRPTGANATFPSTPTTAIPDGFVIDVDTPQGMLVFTVNNTYIIGNVTGIDVRWIGGISGGFEGKETWEGVSLHEVFTF